MIVYNTNFFGTLLLRIHGGAAYKATLPASISVVILLVAHHLPIDTSNSFKHPYVIAAMLSSVSFLIIFRANFAYQRYWEGSGAVYHMMSKFLDAVIMVSTFHYQSSDYSSRSPPSFSTTPGINFNARLSRRRNHDIDSATLKFVEGYGPRSEDVRTSNGSDKNRSRSSFNGFSRISAHGIKGLRQSLSEKDLKVEINMEKYTSFTRVDPSIAEKFSIISNEKHKPRSFERFMPLPQIHSIRKEGEGVYGVTGHARLDGGVGRPSLYLQELTHLASLLNAVALSVLRCETATTVSPLVEYDPFAALPPLDQTNADIDDPYNVRRNAKNALYYWLGWDKTAEYRQRYYEATPLTVIGGISEGELEMIRSARTDGAKVALCTLWLVEFITRESLNGGTGQVAAPILSRIHQFLSDGQIGFNNARKVKQIPFPFPHAQICLIGAAIVLPSVPMLALQYSNYIGISIFITYSVVFCVYGLYEVARELETPFVNIPNEIPLNTLQASFNESLIQCYRGYHPDAFWDTEKYMEGTEYMRIREPSQSDDKSEAIKNGTTSHGENLTTSDLRQEIKNQEELIMRLKSHLERSEGQER